FSTGKPTATVGLREVGSLAFTPDGKCLLASGEGRILLVDVGRTSIIANLRPAQESHQFASSADGTRLLVCGNTNERGGVEYFALGSAPAFPFDRIWADGPHQYLLYDEPAISPRGDRVAVSLHDGFRDRVRNVVQLRDPATGKVRFEVDFGASDPL